MSTSRQLLELVVHRRQAALDRTRRRAGVAMSRKTPPCGAAAAGLHLGVDRPGDLVARQQVGRAPVVVLVLVPGVGFLLGVRRLGPEELGDVVEHEAPSFRVPERAAVAAHALGDQDPAHAGRPDHPGRVELEHSMSIRSAPGVERHRHAVAGVLPGVGGDLPGLADAAGGQHHRLRLEEHELARSRASSRTRRNPVAVLQEARCSVHSM